MRSTKFLWPHFVKLKCTENLFGAKQNRQVSLPLTEFVVELFLFVASGALGISARYFFNCFTFDATDSCLRVART